MRVGAMTVGAASIVAAGVVVWSSPTAADDAVVIEDADAFVDGEDPTATAREEVIPPDGSTGGGGDSPWSCEYSVAIEDDWEFAIWDMNDTGTEAWRQYSETGRWLDRECTNSETDAVLEGMLPEGDEVDLEALAREALRAVSVPDLPIATSPAADAAVVQVPTWLWIDADWWEPYTGTATAGRVTSTVTASPVRTSWSMGDGDTEVCSGPGVAWAPGLSEDATDCSHIYRSSSEPETDGVFDVSATVELSATWEANTPGEEGGGLGVITSSSETDLRVREIQAIETR